MHVVCVLSLRGLGQQRLGCHDCHMYVRMRCAAPETEEQPGADCIMSEKAGGRNVESKQQTHSLRARTIKLAGFARVARARREKSGT